MEKASFEAKMREFREMTEKFYKGEISVKEYKAFSGYYGSYAQKGAKSSMVRLRAAGGELDKDKLSFIADCISRYKVEMVHVTTCQALQLHGLSGDNAAKVIEEAFEHGIVTLGGGGDYARNVTASPLSGVEKGEAFDVLPYARAAEDYLLRLVGVVKLPRKLKVGFSNSKKNETHATFRDLGFLANKDGTFDVYSAGGLGNEPKKGLLVAKGLDPKDTLRCIRAMVRMFIAHGNFQDRSKARTRYMQETLGTAGYIKTFKKQLDMSIKEGGLDVELGTHVVNKTGDGTVKNPRAIPQKQDGLYAVSYHPIGGDPVPSEFGKISDAIKDLLGVEVRLSPDQTIYIINCTAKEAEKVLKATDDGARTLFESSISCVGNTICQIGLRDSHGLLENLVKMSRKDKFADGVLPRVHISGCTSSCGSHQIGVIGFQGASARVNGRTVPAFKVSVSGSHLAGKERFGDAIGTMTQSDIPKFMEEIGNAVTASKKDFMSWFKDRKAFDAIAAKYLVKE